MGIDTKLRYMVVSLVLRKELPIYMGVDTDLGYTVVHIGLGHRHHDVIKGRPQY